MSASPAPTIARRNPSGRRQLGRILRSGLLLAAVPGLVLAAAGPAAAVAGEGWPQAPEVSALQILTIVLLIPLGLAVVLAVTFALPGLASDRSQKSSSNLPATWMGGPKEGTDTLPEGSSASDDTGSDARGGSSARW